MTKTISIIVMIFSSVLIAHGQTAKEELSNYPPPIGFINDFEDLLTEDQERSLDSLVTSFENETSIEIAIVTLNGSVTSKENFDTYTLGLANYWGVGKKGLDNGILIGFSSDLRSIRIQNGYGIERILSDKETREIIDMYFIPEFKKGEYFEGIKRGTIEIIKKLKY